MKKLITKKKLLTLILVLALTTAFFSIKNSFGMQHYQEVDFPTGLITATVLNVREGPGLNYGVITKVYKNEYIRVFAQIGDWYVIQTDEDYVGVVNKTYVKPIYPQTQDTTEENDKNNETTDNENPEVTSESIENSNSLTAEEQEIFELVNNQRIENGLTALLIDEEVQNVARIKANEMVEQNYFSHTSPTYGSPFEMLKSFQISYKVAGENIAGNSSSSKAVTAWMNSEGHKANILSNNYNYCGVGVVDSSKYGKLYVQIFVGK